MLHLVDRSPYKTMLCGASIESVGEDWTDAIYEIVDAPPTHCCQICLQEGRGIVRDTRLDTAWQKEIANQAGMGLGVQSYNDHMGY